MVAGIVRLAVRELAEACASGIRFPDIVPRAQSLGASSAHAFSGLWRLPFESFHRVIASN
jgi:hypothetical protein